MTWLNKTFNNDEYHTFIRKMIGSEYSHFKKVHMRTPYTRAHTHTHHSWSSRPKLFSDIIMNREHTRWEEGGGGGRGRNGGRISRDKEPGLTADPAVSFYHMVILVFIFQPAIAKKVVLRSAYRNFGVICGTGARLQVELWKFAQLLTTFFRQCDRSADLDVCVCVDRQACSHTQTHEHTSSHTHTHTHTVTHTHRHAHQCCYAYWNAGR